MIYCNVERQASIYVAEVMHRQVYIGEERVWRKTDMEVAVPVLLKMVFCLFLLKALAARPHSSGRRRMLGVFFCVKRISDDVF